MTVSDNDLTTIKAILSFEHYSIAARLKLIDDPRCGIDNDLLYSSIGLIDRLSRAPDDFSRNIVICVSSILWTYRKSEWDGLKDFLVLVLSRIGYSPSSIMVDSGYDFVNRTYSGTHGLLNELAVSIHQLSSEVKVCGETFLLTEFQYKVWKKIDDNSVLGISAPTSAGKSFVIALKAVDLISRHGGSVIYIVPTLSLVSQVSIDFRKLLNYFGIENYTIQNTYNGVNERESTIYVLTQEKAIGAFSQSDAPFKNLKMLVVDEIQNIERVAHADDQRAKTLYDLMVDFRHSEHPNHIIISGPRIDNIADLGVDVFGENTDEEEAKSSPVANFTYSIVSNNKKFYFRQYSTILDEPLSLPIKYHKKICVGGVQYRENFHCYLSNVVYALGSDSKNIIFSPTSTQARKTASYLSAHLSSYVANGIDSLIGYLSDTVHPKYEMCKTLKNGIAFHHGKLPHHVRRVIEKAISDKLVNNIVCTTTLMQGVNLPAQNVLIRNPNLFVTKRFGHSKLTAYEIANLRGRAGRLLKDFIGRTIVLDGNTFESENADHEDLFENKTKELKPSYGLTYEAYGNKINYGLRNMEVPADFNSDYSFLLTYIRQSILRHKEGSLVRFKSVGIEMSLSSYSEIKKTLDLLKVPIDVCLKNRYWDPLDLNQLYLNRNSFDLPLSPNEGQISYRLKDVLDILRVDYGTYYKRYFNVPHSDNINLVLSACINAEHWLKERPLSYILNTDYHDDSDKIDKTINLLQNKISYGLPMLLRPIYSIVSPSSPFLRCLELGAYHPVAKRLIEYSVPRETAIHLSNNYFKGLSVESSSFDNDLLSQLKKCIDKLDYWTRCQLETIV